MNDMKTWAEREVELACQRERENAKDANEWNYGVACYRSALKAYKTMIKDGHSGMSWSIAKNILMRLCDGHPLTPIIDTENVWNDVSGPSDLPDDQYKAMYQCKRMSSLFKYVLLDGSIKYRDVERVRTYDTESDTPWSNGFITRLIDELIPITMPYCPDSKPIKVFVEEILTDKSHGDYDTMAVLYAEMPDGKILDIKRYFKESENGRFIEIADVEYEHRKTIADQAS